MKYAFKHEYNSFNIKKLTTYNVMTNKPRYLYYCNKSGYYPEIVTINRDEREIHIQHEGVFNYTTGERAEKIVNAWMDKNTPTFRKGIAYLIINNAYTESDQWVVDHEKYDANDIEYDLLDLLTEPTKPSSIVAVCSDKEYPILYYGYSTAVDIDNILLTDLFKGLSYTKGAQSTELATKFMTQYLIESYGLKPTLGHNTIYLEELRSADYVFQDHITTEEISALFLEAMDDDYVYGYSTYLETEKLTLNEILYTDGLMYVTERAVVENDLGFDHFDYIIATPLQLSIYFVLEDEKKLLEVLGFINDILDGSVLSKDAYNVIRLDKEALDALKKVSKNVSVL